MKLMNCSIFIDDIQLLHYNSVLHNIWLEYYWMIMHKCLTDRKKDENVACGIWKTGKVTTSLLYYKLHSLSIVLQLIWEIIEYLLFHYLCLNCMSQYVIFILSVSLKESSSILSILKSIPLISLGSVSITCSVGSMRSMSD